MEKKIIRKILIIFLCLKLKIYGLMLELPCQGDSNEYPQSMFRNKNKKKYIPLYTQVPQHRNVGRKRVFVFCFLMIINEPHRGITNNVVSEQV